MFLSQIKTLFRIPKHAFGKYKFQIALLVTLGFLSGLLESIGITALIPLFSFVTKTDMAQNRLSWVFESVFSSLDISFTLWTLLSLMALIFFVKAIITIGFGYIRTKIIADYETSTQRALYEKTLFSTWPHLLKQKIGHLENALTMDIVGASTLLKQISAFVLDGTNLLVYGAVALAISLSVTGAAFLFGAFFLLVSRPFVLRTKRFAAERSATYKNLAHQVNETIAGLKTVKAMRVEKDIARQGRDFFEQIRKIKIGQYFSQSTLPILMEPLSFLFIIGVFAVSYTRDSFSLPAFIAVIYLVQRIFAGVNNIQKQMGAIADTLPFVQKLLQAQEEAEKNKEQDSGKLPFAFNQKLQFQHVGFSYLSGKPALSDISFAIAKGETIGIIGASGSGKTTIVDLLLRLFEPGSGHIAVDGTAIGEIQIREWRKNIGYVSQDLFLKNDTIENNIRFYDQSLTTGDIVRAAKAAYSYDFISKLPQGFQTNIGDRGVMLSNGQRQRIVLARVLARKPSILVLDEATSALDNESEQYIQRSIQELRGDATVLIIAHRLSTVMNADRIMAFEKGKIIEEGNPRELLQDPNSYFSRTHAHSI